MKLYCIFQYFACAVALNVMLCPHLKWNKTLFPSGAIFSHLIMLKSAFFFFLHLLINIYFCPKRLKNKLIQKQLNKGSSQVYWKKCYIIYYIFIYWKYILYMFSQFSLLCFTLKKIYIIFCPFSNNFSVLQNMYPLKISKNKYIRRDIALQQQ